MQYFLRKVKYYVPYGTSSRDNINFLVLLGILLLIPFSIRFVFQTKQSIITGAYSDFTSYSVYFSDFLILAYILINWHKIKNLTNYLFLIILWIILELLLNSGQNTGIMIYFSARVVLLVLFAFLMSQNRLSLRKIEIISISVVLLGFLQAFLAIYQFIAQKSAGLYILGESHLSPDMYGVAKIVAHGTKYIRGYGSFPHSNLLSAFLVISTLLNIYLLTKDYQKSTKFILSLTFLVNIIGIFVSFSRGGISAFIISMILFTIYIIFNGSLKKYKYILITGIAGIIISIFAFYPFLNTRATLNDNAVKERVFYNNIGKKIISKNWLLGTGLGTSVLHMEQYSPTDLEPWEVQPIHNYYLLALAEWGIGFIFLITFIIIAIYQISINALRTIKNTDPDSYWTVTLSLIGISFLYLFMFDHYFYTIWQTQLLLWLFIGLFLNQIANNSRTSS